MMLGLAFLSIKILLLHRQERVAQVSCLNVLLAMLGQKSLCFSVTLCNIIVLRHCEPGITYFSQIYNNIIISNRKVSMPIGVSDRDLVQFSTTMADKDKNLTAILYKNATHPNKPEVSGIVR